jgi:hypothetical protein
MWRFKEFCGLPIVHGTIDGTQVYIQKLKGLFVIDFFHRSQKLYNMKLQVVINYKKKFKDIFIKIPWFGSYASQTCIKNYTCGPILIRTQ